MAEEESELELDRFKKELESLLNDECRLQSRSYCARFCELVEEYTSRWQVPLPQLQVLRSALCAFVRGAASFPSDCEHVRYTLSSLALSVFELLLFFARDEFPEDPLKDILDSFQECHSSLVKYQNVYLLQVRHIIRDGGPWASPLLEGILKEVEQPQEEVDRYLSSELSMFFELRVRYLLACERSREAMALALKCSQNPSAGRCLFFKQTYLSCLWKSSQRERIYTEMAEIDGKDAVEILCIAENEEKDELLLELSRGFLLQQLQSGDMYYLWDLVFIWCKLYLRLKAPGEHFLQECKTLLMSATNVKAIFPFMKVILSENLGKEGLTFCVELCAQALQTDLKDDPVAKSLIYKTIAYLFPNDLEICRACALLVFFLERTVEAYKTVFFLYNHPDLEYHLDASHVGNNVRFEVIRILKKGLFFDPEFWSLLNIKTNCLKLMSDEVARAALCEITEEDRWGPSYCVREHCKCRAEPDRTAVRQEERPGSRDNEEGRVPSASADVSSEILQYKRRGRKPGSRLFKGLEPFPVRRSFRQLDSAQNHAGQLNNRCQRFLTRQAEKNILKRRGRKPRWLLEQLAALEENTAPGQPKKPGRKPNPFSSLKGILVDVPVIEITMEYSYPDNEVELPADVQGRSTSRTTTSSTERLSDRPQTGPCIKAPDSFRQLLFEKPPCSWREDDFQSQDIMVTIRKFHTYAKVPEEEGSPSLLHLMDTAALAAPLAVKQEDGPRPVKDLGESVEGTNATSLTAAETQEIHVVSDRADPSSLSAVVQADGKITTTFTTTTTAVNSPKDQSASVASHSSVQVLEDAPDVSSLGTTPDKATDNVCMTSEKETDSISTSENAPPPLLPPNSTPGLVHQSQVCTPKGIPDTHEHGVDDAPDGSKNTSAAEIILETPDALEESKAQDQALQQTSEVETPRNYTTSVVPDAQTKRRCKLCNKTYETPLNHALWHYRTEKKCMFCDKLAMTRGALQHFQKHIKNLGKEESQVETQKREEIVTEAAGSPDQTFQGSSPPKKAKPGFAQIKSRLLMRLKLTRKARTQSETSDKGEMALKETDARTPESAPEQKESSAKDDQQNVLHETIRYVTRGSIKKSEHKGRQLRAKLGRKGKPLRVRTGGDGSAPKDGSVHRLNGVTEKKRKIWWRQEDSDLKTDKDVARGKEEKKTDSEKSEKTAKSNRVNYNIRTKVDKATGNDTEEDSKNSAKSESLEEPRAKKKKHGENKEKAAAKMVKKRKIEEDATEKKTVKKQQNGSEAESCETPKTLRKRRVCSTPAVGCPVDACTFQAMPGPVLSHVLIHHPGDTNALEFFYNLAAKKCVFCARRIWSPQHFFDHVVSHRGNLKHPCYHAACQKRFKTRTDVGDHMERDHNPLKARCCFPECTVESASLKDLYSHEKNHYKTVKTVTSSEKGADKPGLKASRVKSAPEVAAAAQQRVTQSISTDNEIPPPPLPPPPPGKMSKQRADKPEDENQKLTLNKSSVNYGSKSPRLVNGHGEHAQESGVKAHPANVKEQDAKSEQVAVKPFSRLPPSAYLDELYLSMPKKWRRPQTPVKGVESNDDVLVKRQSCSRCNAAFDGEEELQLHRDKCTSLFGFDSDDENAF